MIISKYLPLVLIITLASVSACLSVEADINKKQLSKNTLIERYASIAEHRTGTSGDIETSTWLNGELTKLGVDSQLLDWTLQRFELIRHSLKIADIEYDNFPFWFPASTSVEGITAPLVLWNGEPTKDLTGKIVLYRLQPGQIEMHFNVNPLLEIAAEQGALAAIVILDHPIQAVSAQNAVSPHHQKELALPALIVSQADAESLIALAHNNTEARIIINGNIKTATAYNVVGKLNRQSRQWIVISTPTSGWFAATNERGPGIAMWLKLAEWVSNNNLDCNLLFVGLSGHELAKMGWYSLLEEAVLPSSDQVPLWLHLGSGIAVSKPLLFGVTSVKTLEQDTRELFVKEKKTLYFDEAKMPKGSEMYLAVKAGYPVVGLFGADPTIHTSLDQKPAIDAENFSSILAALKQLILKKSEQTLQQPGK